MKAVFFDFDGTLCDTAEEICACLSEALVSCGYPPVGTETTRACVGNGARRLVERVLPAGAEGDAERVLGAFRAVYAASDGSLTRVYPGIGELLSHLKESGVLLGILTNKPQEATVKLTEKFFGGIFDYVGGDDGAFPVKPDPSRARYAALTLRVAPRDCVLVGDGETDAETAKRAGMAGVAVLWGYRSRDVLERAGARVFARDAAELRKILGKFFENR